MYYKGNFKRASGEHRGMNEGAHFRCSDTNEAQGLHALLPVAVVSTWLLPFVRFRYKIRAPHL
jgi:hypothetical protein